MTTIPANHSNNNAFPKIRLMPKVVYLGAVHRNIVMRAITQINEMNANFYKQTEKHFTQMRANGWSLP